ncbi:MAG: TonB-dependent receptor domain-containing protein, partial [Ignavibacteriales bacterium]
MIESSVDPQYRAKSDLAELQISYDLGSGLTLTSETGYNADVLFSMEDYNRFNTAPGAWRQPTDFLSPRRPGVLIAGPNGGIFCDPQIGCSDRLVAIDVSTAASRQFSQEFRLSSDYEGPFNFSVGANFLRYDTEDKYYVFINSLSLQAAATHFVGTENLPPYVGGVTDNRECLPTGFTPPDFTVVQPVFGCVYIDPNPISSLNDQGHNYFLSRNPYKLISYAVFGEAYYNLTDNLKVTAGLRWTVDKKRAPRIPSWVVAARTAGYPTLETVNQEWREPTGRLAIDWKPHLSFTDETLVYGSYAHGYKAGGANPPPTGAVVYCDSCGSDWPALSSALNAQSATHPKTFEPEFVNAFEVGSKNTLLDGRLTLNMAGFYYDYTGYQISQIVDRSAVNLNFDARVWGLEMEADWRPLENLRLGLKLGYENTRVADGMKAVDLMDRTAGHPGWVIVKPFPTFPSNCILPADLFIATNPDGSQYVYNVGGVGGGHPGACEMAYVLGLDPITGLPYTPNPTQVSTDGMLSSLQLHPGYAGFNPFQPDINNGEGFYKDLSGNALPNAPHYTATLTTDYTVPLPNDWLMTLHGDFYYQSESWARIFNTPGYDKLKAYTNVNLAAIFSNDDAGWKVMAYVKNFFDKDNITGAFLNSDDTGLTTNVFLNEPRLYGLRVTKDWTGQGWWTGANPNHPAGEPYPFTVEIGGQVQRQRARNDAVAPTFADVFPAALNTFAQAEHKDFNWGDGREIKLTYQPTSQWKISGSYRYGRTNTGTSWQHATEQTPSVCAFDGYLAFLCPIYAQMGYAVYQSVTNWSDVAASSREQHEIVDFQVGHDVGMGALSRSELVAGLRYASLESSTDVNVMAVPDWYFPAGWLFQHQMEYTRYRAQTQARRKFKGAGPTLSWQAATRLLGTDTAGHLDLDWTVTGGVLFGKQKITLTGHEKASSYQPAGYTLLFGATIFPPMNVTETEVNESRSKNATVPVIDLSLGLSYEIQRVKIGAGYR